MTRIHREVQAPHLQPVATRSSAEERARRGIGADAVESVWLPGHDRQLAENQTVTIHPVVNFRNPNDVARYASISFGDNILIGPKSGERMTPGSIDLVTI